EHLDVRRRVGTRRTPDRRLVDGDDLIDVRDALDAVVGADQVLPAVAVLLHVFLGPGTLAVALAQPFEEDVVDERALARAADAGAADEAAERHLDVDPLEIVVPGVDDAQAVAVAGPALGGDGDLLLAGQVLSGEAVGVGEHFGEGAGGDDLPATDAGPGAEV